ncbi:MAG: helix-turn-helix transcriptional regulator [Ruminococcaceae bacterium]|nr:helix-turn-helix transcriptional regulator [Oscillospiraceae bacterium]
MSIGTNIYTLRKEKKITQSLLAEKLGVSCQAISKWENDQCAPDVSLFPIMADLFEVSIDRLFGYHMNSYADEVKEIMKAADDSMDTYKEIEIISEGLSKYPNSPDLKIYLAFSLSMVNRMSNDENEKSEAIKKAIKLCNEVVDSCGDIKQVDSALHMLTRIYNETGNYNKSEECIAKISADSYDSRILGTVNMLGVKKCFVEQEQYAEMSLWKMYWTMSHVFESLVGTFIVNAEYEKALAFLEAHDNLLSIFDSGCENFNATYKIIVSDSRAKTYMKMGNKEKCLEELRRFWSLSEQVKEVAKCEDLNIAARNPVYFSSLTEEIGEEYMTSINPERALYKFDSFFGDDEEYLRFKKEVMA